MGKVGPGGIYIVQAPCGDLLQIHRDLEYPDEEDEEVPGDEPDLDPPDDDEYFSEPDRATSEYDAEPAWWSVSEDGAEPELDSMPLHEKVVFKVYRVDLTAKKFVEVSSLGDNVLFLGLNQSLCLCAKEYPELKGNHIYFTDAFGKHEKRDMGVFNLDNLTSEKIVSPRISSNWPPPIG